MATAKSGSATKKLRKKNHQARPATSAWAWPGLLAALASALLAGALGLALSSYNSLVGLDQFTWPEAWSLADTNQPMLVGADDYYYYKLAEDALTSGCSSVPPLAGLACLAAKISGASLSGTVFGLSVAFSLALGLLAALWGRLLKMKLAPIMLAALAINLIPAWLARSGPNYFDTDPAIALFWQAGLLGLAWAGQAGIKWLEKAGALLAALVSLALLAWFWRPGLALAGGTLGAWLIFCSPIRPGWGWKTRLAVAGAMLAWGAAIIILPPHQAPAPTRWADFISDQFRLAFTLKSDLFYTSIMELGRPSLNQWLVRLGGHWAGGLAALLAAAALFATRRETKLALGLGFICALAGFRSIRFMYLFAFPLALSLGFLPWTLAELAGKFYPKLGLRWPRRLGGLALVAIMASCLTWAWSDQRNFPPHWKRGHDRLALALKEAAPAGAKLWNWWDDGYFLAARTKMKPFFDNGTQTPFLAHIVARPCVMEDHRLAARWIRFFALRGPEGLQPLAAIWGEDEALVRLESLLAQDEIDPADESLAQLPGGQAWLFPEGRVFWYMPTQFLRLSKWWVPLGQGKTPDPELTVRHLEAVAKKDFTYEPATNNLKLSQKLTERGYGQFGQIIITDLTPLEAPWPKAPPLYLVFSFKNDYGYIVNEYGLKSLPLALMVPGGLEMKNFQPVAVDDEYGGVWEVLP